MQYNTEIQSKFHSSLKDNKRNHRKKTTKLCALKDKKGEIIIKEKDIEERWKEYTEKLCKKDETIKEVFTAMTFVQEPTIAGAEVSHAKKEISSGKSPGICVG